MILPIVSSASHCQEARLSYRKLYYEVRTPLVRRYVLSYGNCSLFNNVVSTFLLSILPT